MTEANTHHGSCHCGAVRYRVTMDLSRAIACNCSICSRTGTLLTFVPASSFVLERGADALRDYQFGKKRIHHLFCTTCGVRSFARGTAPDGSEMIAVNVRCLEDVDPKSLELQEFDGKSLPVD